MNKKRGDFLVRWGRVDSRLFFHASFSVILENTFLYELCIIAMGTEHERSHEFCYLELQYDFNIWLT